MLPEQAKDWYEAAQHLAKDAGRIIKQAIGQRGKAVEVKSSYADLVTQTDKDVEKFLIKALKERFPDHKFIGEESTSDGAKCELTDSPTWIIDPVDGTMNFVHGYPFVAVSIGLTVNKEVIIGVIYLPMLDKMYCAMKGNGSFCNGVKLEVSGQTDISKALIALEAGSNRQPEVLKNVFANYQAMIPKVHGVRSMGSAAFNMTAVASGNIDCYFEYAIYCWDIAGGKIIVEEAGGVVIDPEGGPLDLMSRRVLCAASLELATSIGKHLHHYRVSSN